MKIEIGQVVCSIFLRHGQNACCDEEEASLNVRKNRSAPLLRTEWVVMNESRYIRVVLNRGSRLGGSSRLRDVTNTKKEP